LNKDSSYVHPSSQPISFAGFRRAWLIFIFRGINYYLIFVLPSQKPRCLPVLEAMKDRNRNQSLADPRSHHTLCLNVPTFRPPNYLVFPGHVDATTCFRPTTISCGSGTVPSGRIDQHNEFPTCRHSSSVAIAP